MTGKNNYNGSVQDGSPKVEVFYNLKILINNDQDEDLPFINSRCRKTVVKRHKSGVHTDVVLYEQYMDGKSCLRARVRKRIKLK